MAGLEFKCPTRTQFGENVAFLSSLSSPSLVWTFQIPSRSIFLCHLLDFQGSSQQALKHPTSEHSDLMSPQARFSETFLVRLFAPSERVCVITHIRGEHLVSFLYLYLMFFNKVSY